MNLRFCLDSWCFASERHFAALTLRFSRNLTAVQKMDNNIKHCHTPLNHRFQLHLWFLPLERHFETLTVKLSLNAITTEKIADLQNSVICHVIIVFM